MVSYCFELIFTIICLIFNCQLNVCSIEWSKIICSLNFFCDFDQQKFSGKNQSFVQKRHYFRKYNNNKNIRYFEKGNLYFLLILIVLESKSNIKNWHLSLNSKMLFRLFSYILVYIIYNK